MILALVVAMAQNRVIGHQGRIPWTIPDDLKRFRIMTTGYPVIMGRTTYESIGRPLRQRTNIVLTTRTDYRPEGCLVAHSVADALALAESRLARRWQTAFVIGGGDVYRQTIDLADRLYVTQVDAAPEGDALFPPIDHDEWRIADVSQWRGEHPRYAYVDYVR